jgi:hypothetical protein
VVEEGVGRGGEGVGEAQRVGPRAGRAAGRSRRRLVVEEGGVADNSAVATERRVGPGRRRSRRATGGQRRAGASVTAI